MLQGILHYTVSETYLRYFRQLFFDKTHDMFLIRNYPYNVLKAMNQNSLTCVHVPNIEFAGYNSYGIYTSCTY